MDLIDLASGAFGDRWELRRLAALMLENQILKIPAKRLVEFDLLFKRLGIKSETGPSTPVNRDVLAQGYSSTQLTGFVPQFRRRLSRLNRVHTRIRGLRTSRAALEDFLEASRRDNKITVARCLFSPDEVVNQILRQIKTSRGVRDVNFGRPMFVEQEAQHALGRLPEYEARIIGQLKQSANIYWVSEATSSELNSLVEYPLGTVVLVVKPPGSDIEIEIKRAGLRGPNAFSVVFSRDGECVPPSHRFSGGSMSWLLRSESVSAAKLSRIHRIVHSTEAPVSKFLAVSQIFDVPTGPSQEQILSYLTRPEAFGGGFRQMRTALRECVNSFRSEKVGNLPTLPGELGVTLQFLNQVMPGQAIIANTSSFRLDKIAEYLSERGPDQYYRAGLAVDYDDADARRLADQILEEVLGCFIPPPRFLDYRQYVADALAIPENRARADRNFVRLMGQIGSFWGTLLAIRGHSHGESFVARNVGLKSYWSKGDWQIKIIFMDHDMLHVSSRDGENFRAGSALTGMIVDERYIWGWANGDKFAHSEVDYLEQIYQVGKRLGNRGRSEFCRTLKQSYLRTQAAAAENSRIQDFFNKRFIQRLRDWDRIVMAYLSARPDPRKIARWKRKTRNLLKRRGYKDGSLRVYINSIETNADFLERYRFLY